MNLKQERAECGLGAVALNFRTRTTCQPPGDSLICMQQSSKNRAILNKPLKIPSSASSKRTKKLNLSFLISNEKVKRETKEGRKETILGFQLEKHPFQLSGSLNPLPNNYKAAHCIFLNLPHVGKGQRWNPSPARRPRDWAINQSWCYFLESGWTSLRLEIWVGGASKGMQAHLSGGM